VTGPSAEFIAASQVPPAGQLNVDHVAHFVPHIDAASDALEKLGFTLTPFSPQSHRPEPGGPLVPAGTGNRCVMFRRGYLEFLTPTGDTPIAQQLRAAIQRYTGVHLIAFGTAAPDADRARLEKGGFSPLPPVSLQREVDTGSGRATARFTVVRVAPGTMAEGRIQFCQQHTPEVLWQPRWLEHANQAAALTGVIVCVADPQDAARRYARYTGLLAQVIGSVWRISTQHGYLLFIDPETLARRLDLAPPATPWIAGCVVESENMAATRARLEQSGAYFHALGSDRVLVKLPPALGGVIIFEPRTRSGLSFD
jgi:hypothetical protein